MTLENFRWKDSETAKGYNHPNEEQKSKVTKTILSRMTMLENRESKTSYPAYRVTEVEGLKVKFKKVANLNNIRKSHTGRGAEEVLPSLPSSEFI